MQTDLFNKKQPNINFICCDEKLTVYKYRSSKRPCIWFIWIADINGCLGFTIGNGGFSRKIGGKGAEFANNICYCHRKLLLMYETVSKTCLCLLKALFIYPLSYELRTSMSLSYKTGNEMRGA